MMHQGTFRLLARRRFLPLFVSQFLGAANDNLFKNALVILVVYRLGESAGVDGKILATVAAGLFIAPFFLFSTLAGQLSDRFEKTGLMKLWKAAEIALSALSAWALWAGNVPVMLAALFLMGAQSTFTGPIKYAVLPELLAHDELIAGNALVEGGTFLAILLGTIAGGVLILLDGGVLWVSAGMLAAAVIGFGAALLLPRAHAGNPGVGVRFAPVRDSLELWRLVRPHRELFLSVLGISWFWLVGATYLTQFPAFARNELGADGHAVTLMLTMFSVGIGIGSVLCGRLLRGEISTRYVPYAALGMTLFALDLWFAVGDGAPSATLLPLAEFLARPGSWRVLADLLAFSICGGVYIVPLYATLQAASAEGTRARVVAANNVANALFMVAGAGLCGLLLAAGMSVTGIFLLLGLLNLAIAKLFSARIRC